MVAIKTIQYMYTFSGIKMAKLDVATSYLVLATFSGVQLYLQKLQVRECLSCLNIQDVRCDVGATVYMY